MKRMKKRIVTLALTVLIALAAMSITVFAEEEVVLSLNAGENIETGTLGENEGILWSYNKDTKVMTVTGTDSGLEKDIIITNWGTSGPLDVYGVEEIVFRDCKIIGSARYLFAGASDLQKIDFEGLDTSQVTDMQGMFKECDALSTLDLSKFDTSQVTNMKDMFWGCESISTLDLNKFDTSKVVSMEGMLTNCSKLSSVNLSSFDTSQVTSMGSLFSCCSNLDSVDLSNFDTSKVTDMSSMFSSCRKLSNLDLSNFDATKVTDMGNMFSGCSMLSSVDLSNFDTSKVTDMRALFKSCSNIVEFNLGTFDTSQVTNMSGMFSGCNLVGLNLENFDTSNVTNMSEMFAYCDMTGFNLEYLDTSNVVNMTKMFYKSDNMGNLDFGSLKTSKVTNMSKMFSHSDVSDLDLSDFDMSQVTDTSSMFEECTNLNTLKLSNIETTQIANMNKMFYNCSSLSSLDFNNLKVSQVTDMAFMFYRCGSLENLDLSGFDTSQVSTMESMFYGCMKLVTLDWSNFNTSNVTDMSSMFAMCYRLKELNVSSFDTAKVSNMEYMFDGCEELKELNLSGFNTSKVENMQYMFYGSGLLKLDLSNFDTSQVTNMSHMFKECRSLVELDVSSFDTSKVTDMEEIFAMCQSLGRLDLSNFNTSKVSNMLDMFWGCTSLTELDLSSFNTSQVTSMGSLFSGCTSLTKLDLNSFDTSQVTNMGGMFSGCAGLTELDLSSFDTSNVTHMRAMFKECSNLIKLDLSGFDNSQLKDTSEMFWGCSNLSDLNLSGFNTAKVTTMQDMFRECTKLSSLELSSFDTSQVTDMSRMFYYCSSLSELDLSSFNTSKVISMSSMFYYCPRLKNVNLKSFDVSKVQDMEEMFLRCESLTSLDLSNFRAPEVRTTENMFQGCYSLEELNLSNFDASKLWNMHQMFWRCFKLEELDLSNFNTSNVVDMSWVFSECTNLKQLNLSGFSTANVKDIGGMFADCISLEYLDLSSFDLSKVTNAKYMLEGIEECVSLNTIVTPQKMPSGQWKQIPLPAIFYDAQLNAVTVLTDTNCNTVLTKKIEYPSFEQGSKYQLYITDSEGTPISDAAVVYDNQSGTTDNKGKVEFALVTEGMPTITVSKEGYTSWSNQNNNWESQSGGYETIVLYTEQEGSLKLSSVYYKGAMNRKTNLLTKAKTVSLNSKDIIDLGKDDFTIICAASDTSQVSEYQLWQNKKQIAVSANGIFSLDTEKGFVEGGGCFVRVISQDGESTDTKINLSFVQNAVNEVNSVALMDGAVSVKVKDSIPFLGGSEVNVELPKLPADVEVTEEKIYIGFNTDLTGSEDADEYFKDLKSTINSAYKASTTNVKALKKMMKDNKTFALPGGKFEANIIGYVEGDIGSSTAKGELYFVVKGTTPTFGFNTVVVVVPVTVQIKGSIEAAVGAELSYNFATGTFDGGLDFNATIALNAFGGVGVGGTVGVGAYGDAAVAMESRIMGTNPGVQTIDLTGELGLKAYLGIFSYKKAFAHNTWNLYTQKTREIPALMEEEIYADMYNATNYQIESLEYLNEESEWNGYGIAAFAMDANTDFNTLLEGTYLNAQPVMVAGDNALYAAFLRGDAETSEVYVAVSKMVDGIWSNPVRVDENALLDDAPQLLADEEGNIWLAYAKTAEGTDITNMTSHAKNQTIVVGRIDLDTCAFTSMKEYRGTGYAHMQQLVLVDGKPALVWVDSAVTDDNSVLTSADNKLFTASYQNGTWSEGVQLCQWSNVVYEIAAGDKGLACNLDMDNDLLTMEDRSLQFYDWEGNAGEKVAGVTGHVSYGILPGQESADFLWNGADVLTSMQGSVSVPGVTQEYAVLGNSVYYSAADDDGADLFVIKQNEDGSFGEYIQLTNGERYLENLSVASYAGTDVVIGMHTQVEITEDDVTQNKNLVWSMVQPVNDIRIDELEYDRDIVTSGEVVPVTVTVTNAGDHAIREISMAVNQEIVATEPITLLPGQSKELVVNLTYPDALTEYTLLVMDENGIESDYTQENNSATIRLGYANLSIHANLQQIGETRNILTEVINEGITAASGTVTLYDEEGQLIGLSSFTDLQKGNMVLVQTPLFDDTSETTVTVTVTTEQEELYTYDNSDTVYLPVLENKEAEKLHLLDVPEGWKLTAAQYVADRGIMKGTSETEAGIIFSPEMKLKREMLAMILYAAEDKPEVLSSNTFLDYEENGYYIDAVEWSAAHNIVSGVGNGKFGVGQDITREQLALMLYKYAQMKGYDTTATKGLTEYLDANEVHDWAVDAMKWATANEVISGQPTTAGKILNPRGDASRVECAAMLRSFMMKFVEN